MSTLSVLPVMGGLSRRPTISPVGVLTVHDPSCRARRSEPSNPHQSMALRLVVLRLPNIVARSRTAVAWRVPKRTPPTALPSSRTCWRAVAWATGRDPSQAAHRHCGQGHAGDHLVPTGPQRHTPNNARNSYQVPGKLRSSRSPYVAAEATASGGHRSRQSRRQRGTSWLGSRAPHAVIVRREDA